MGTLVGVSVAERKKESRERRGLKEVLEVSGERDIEARPADVGMVWIVTLSLTLLLSATMRSEPKWSSEGSGGVHEMLRVSPTRCRSTSKTPWPLERMSFSGAMV